MAADHRGVALTLRETADQLGVSPQRVSQLLSSNELEGPKFEGAHAPKDAGRVWPASLAALLSRRANGPAQLREVRPEPVKAGFAERLSVVEQAVASIGRADTVAEALIRRERAARQVAVQLKVEGDVLREQLATERRRSADLAQQLLAMQARLEQAESERGASEAARAIYDEALSTLLAADDVGDL